MSFFTDRFSARIGGSSFGSSEVLFKFEAIKRAKREAVSRMPHLALIDMGVGESDQGAYPVAVETLAREAGLSENRRYADNGIEEFKVAASRYLEREFGVSGIDPGREVVHCIGSKSAFALLPLAFIDPGDVSLVTVPGYPILGTNTNYLGGRVVSLPLLERNGFLPDLDSISREDLDRAKLLYLNYPNNPTGARATESFFREVVDFARLHHIVVVHDAAYAALVYPPHRPLSFLSIPGAKDVGVEVHSLSKSFNMTGWRLGFVAGNAEAVSAFAAVKDTADSGQFRAIQKAGEACLMTAGLTEEALARYERRFDLLVPALRSLGFDAKKSPGTFYCYVRAPMSAEDASGLVRFPTAESFSTWLVSRFLISTVPWDDAGSYVRFSVTFEAYSIEDERRVIEELAERLSSVRFYWE